MTPLAVELTAIDKRFGEVHANRAVDLQVERGHVHGIVGENGAGKSTLMNILYGFHEADSGTIAIDGQPVRLRSAQQAIAQGIGMVHQHFMLVDRFTVLENIVLGVEQGFTLAPSLARARRELARLSAEFGLAVDADARVRDLGVGALQRVEILKALYRGARILILDEPTGVLTPQETDALFQVLRQLKARGVTLLLITHKLREIVAITDRVTVMRGGAVVATLATADTDEAELAELMVGRKLALGRGGAARAPGERRLSARGLSWRDAHGVARLHDMSLDVHASEIVGVAGVSGNGQGELLALLAGLVAPQQGTIALRTVDGDTRQIDARHPADPHQLRAWGVAHVPEDRHRLGLVLGFPMWESALLGYDDDAAVRRGPALLPLLDHPAMHAQCRRMMDEFDVRPRDERLASAKFSGGNQQKLILAREFRRAPRLLLIGQPTRGVDIGAIEFIHRRIVALRDAGCAVLLVSSELDEILALADRIVVMSGGRVTGTLARAEATERRLGELMGQGGGAAPAPSGSFDGETDDDDDAAVGRTASGADGSVPFSDGAPSQPAPAAPSSWRA